MECPNDINGMIDAAKFADLALLLIDGSYGFEMVRFFLTMFDSFHCLPQWTTIFFFRRSVVLLTDNWV